MTLPHNLPPSVDRVDTQRVRPEHPHWPLVFMLVLTQLSAGAFGTLLWTGASVRSALASLAIGAMSLGLAALHLGRPAFAWRALKGLRRSWLSREVLALGLFAGAASTAAVCVLRLPGQSVTAALTAVLGAAGVTCSACIYIVPARPAWHSRYTLAEFFSTGLLLGPLFVWMLDGASGSGALLPTLTAAGASAQLLTQTLKFLWLSQSDVFELRASGRLLSGMLRNFYLLRLALLVAAGIAMPLAMPGAAPIAFGLALFGEFLGRWLFFVSVVPKNIGAAFVRAEAA